MIRRLLKTMVVALTALMTVATMAEAAPKRVVHHRTRHSTRVSSGSAATARKKTVHRRARRPTTKRKTTPTTKPR